MVLSALYALACLLLNVGWDRVARSGRRCPHGPDDRAEAIVPGARHVCGAAPVGRVPDPASSRAYSSSPRYSRRTRFSATGSARVRTVGRSRTTARATISTIARGWSRRAASGIRDHVPCPYGAGALGIRTNLTPDTGAPGHRRRGAGHRDAPSRAPRSRHRAQRLAPPLGAPRVRRLLRPAPAPQPGLADPTAGDTSGRLPAPLPPRPRRLHRVYERAGA